MGSIFVVKHKQPKDIVFKKSGTHEEMKTPKYKNTAKLTFMVIVICISTMYYGFCLNMISAVSSQSLSYSFGAWAGQNSTIGLLIGFFPLGGALGALLSRFLIRKFTRKQSLIIIDTIIIIVTGLLQIPNIGLLLALRIVQGILVGINMAIVPLYMNELVPLDLHGSEGVISQVLIIFGVVIDCIFKVAFTEAHSNLQLYWRFVFAFSGFPSLIQLILLMVWIPESPMSLIIKGNVLQARQILGQFNVTEVLDDVLAEMVHESKIEETKKIISQNAQNDKKENIQSLQTEVKLKTQVQQIQRKIERLDSKTKQILDAILEIYKIHTEDHPAIHKILKQHHQNTDHAAYIVKKVPKKALFLGFELHFLQQFSGIKMVMTQLSIVFSKYNSTLTLYSPLIGNGCQVITTGLSAILLFRFGRRNPTLVGNLVLCILNFVIAALFLANSFTQNLGLIYASFVLIVLFMIGYSLSLGPIVWPYVPELIPTQYVPFASSMNWIAASICTIATPYILNAVGSPYPVFFFFGGTMLIFFVINSKYLIQTKGLTHSQIAEELSK